jgi:Double-GTPase 2
VAKGYFCPRCLERIAEESVVYRTRTGEQTEKPRLVYERGPREWSRAIWHGDPSPLYQVNPKVQADRYARGVHALCPHGHRIPPRAFDIPSLVVGLVGETSAGKTVYLGTLLEQLDRGRLLPYLDFDPDEYSEALQEQIFGDFYRDGTVPQATAPGRGDAQREALTRTAVSDSVDKFYLSFFDASGEQSTRQHHGTDNRFLFVADIVMHFVTPEALGLSRRTGRRRLDQRQSWHTTNAAVRSAASAARPGTHAAVIVPKSDDIDPAALDMLTDAREDLDYGRGLTLLRAYQIIEQDSHYIRDLLRSIEDGRVLVDRIESAYQSVTYHLVSATGEPADERFNRFQHRRPQRVLDPLLAALVRVGMLNAHEGRRALK